MTTTIVTAAPAQAQAATYTSRRRQIAVLVVALAFVMDLMDATLLTIALPTIQADSDHPAEIQRLASRRGNDGPGEDGLACFAASERPCRIGVLRRGLVFGGRCAGGDQGRVLGG